MYPHHSTFTVLFILFIIAGFLVRLLELRVPIRRICFGTHSMAARLLCSLWYSGIYIVQDSTFVERKR